MSSQKASAQKAPAPPAPAPQEYPFAYAVVEGPPGQWSAVCLEGVTARSVECIEPNGQPEPQARAMLRVVNAIERRTIGKKWSKP